MPTLDIGYVVTSILVMAVITYLCRMLSMVIFTKKFKNRFIISFLHYVPYGVLSALVIPAIFTSVDSVVASTVGFVVALVLSLIGQKLLVVSAGAVLAVFVCELITKAL